MAKLILDNVGKVYFGGNIGLGNVSFSLESGELLTVFGKAGSGKSTLMKTIATLEDITTGSITIDGVNIGEMSTRDLNISFCTEELPLHKWKNVEYNLVYPLKIRKVEKNIIDERLRYISSLFHLENILSEGVRYLSNSDKCRVMLARCFMRESDFYLIDNIMEHMTRETRDEVIRDLATILPNIEGGVIIATDRLEEVIELTRDKVLILSNGAMQDIDKITDIYENADGIASLRLLSDHRLNECVREVAVDESGKQYIELFGRADLTLPEVYNAKEIIVALRPEDVHLLKNVGEYTGIITSVKHGLHGDIVTMSIGGEELYSYAKCDEFRVGEEASVSVEKAAYFDIKSERRIIEYNKQ